MLLNGAGFSKKFVLILMTGRIVQYPKSDTFNPVILSFD